MFTWNFYVFGYCLRMLAAVLVSDSCLAELCFRGVHLKLYKLLLPSTPVVFILVETKVETNRWHVISVCADLLEKGKTTGQTVRLLFSPRKRREEEKANAVEEPTSHRDDPGKEHGGGKHKKDDASSEKGKKDDHHSKKGDDSSKKGDDSSKKGDDSSKKGDDSSKADAMSEKPSSVIESVGDGAVSEGGDPDKDLEEPKEEDFSVLRRSWFNMVCYGMPNLVVTQ